MSCLCAWYEECRHCSPTFVKRLEKLTEEILAITGDKEKTAQIMKLLEGKYL